MKYIIIIALFACAAVAQIPKEAAQPAYTMTTGPMDMSSTVTATECISFACKGGAIVINTKTGTVDYPKGVSLDDAAVAFWKAVAQAFPRARASIISGATKEPSIDWLGIPTFMVSYAGIDPGFYGPDHKSQVMRDDIEIGLRDDGAVVWRKVK